MNSRKAKIEPIEFINNNKTLFSYFLLNTKNAEISNKLIINVIGTVSNPKPIGPPVL